MTIQIEKIHHVAYRCKDAKETVEWYKKKPKYGFHSRLCWRPCPFNQSLWSLYAPIPRRRNGNVLAFFELPTQPEMGRDENTPKWVQHIALKVKDRQALIDAKEHLEANGIEVLGITNHGIFHSIYFFDPNGHRLELAYDDEKAPQKIAMITEQMKYDMLEEWSKTKRAPQHTHFLHADELSQNSRTAKVDA